MDKIIDGAAKVEKAVGDIGNSLKKVIKAGREFFEELKQIVEEASEEDDDSGNG